MSSPQAFIDRALSAGYTKEEINRFLQLAGPMKGKERQAMEILNRSPDVLDPESKRIAGEAAGSISGGGGMGSSLGSFAKAAIPLAAGFAAGGPILKAAGAALGGAGISGLGDVLSRPTGKDAVALFNTYRKRGLGHTLAQFGSQQAKKFAQGGGAAQQAESQGLPEPLAKLAQETLDRVQDPMKSAQIVAFQVMESGHPLRNLARTFQERSGMNIEDAIAQYLSGGGAAEQPQQAASLSDLSDSELLSLAKKMGLV